MLFVTRKIGDRVVISDGQGNELFIEVIEMRGGFVKLGFSGESNFEVWREELSDSELEHENQMRKERIDDGQTQGKEEWWKGLDYSRPKKEDPKEEEEE